MEVRQAARAVGDELAVELNILRQLRRQLR
jgi:hypothetical protein